MWHREPANRPDQDPSASLPFGPSETHFARLQIANDEDLVNKYPENKAFTVQVDKYKKRLKDLSARLAAGIDRARREVEDQEHVAIDYDLIWSREDRWRFWLRGFVAGWRSSK